MQTCCFSFLEAQWFIQAGLIKKFIKPYELDGNYSKKFKDLHNKNFKIRNKLGILTSFEQIN